MAACEEHLVTALYAHRAAALQHGHSARQEQQLPSSARDEWVEVVASCQD